MRHLGLLIDDLIPDNYPSWKVYTTLNEVLDLLLEKVRHRSVYDLIDTLITEHLELFREVFKRDSVNKQHQSTHYFRILKTVGPASHMSAVKGESKNKEIKAYANLSSCKKNLPYTVAYQHQLHQYQYFSSFSSDNAKRAIGPTVSIKIFSIEKYIVLFSELKSIVKRDIKSCDWDTYTGNKYIHFGIITINNVKKPDFFLIHGIVLDSCTDEIFFITKIK